MREELKCKDFDRYRATYCGLCRTMRKRCGLLAPLVLNFDFTFLALLLAPKQGEELTRCHRCHVPPFRRRCMCSTSPALELAADESVILAWWQLHDRVQDEGFWKGLPARLLKGLLRGSYRRAAAARPDFEQLTIRQLEQLRELETSNCPSLDRPADAFAGLLRGAMAPTGDPAADRAMGELLYHLGRWIYLIDAKDDLERDLADGNYNPIRARFGAEEHAAQLEQTLNHSLNRMCSACALLELGRQEALVENILCLGLPLIQRCVFDGSWSEMKKQKIWRNKE